MDNDICAVIERPAKVPSGPEGIVNDQRDTMIVSHFCDAGYVGDAQARVADGLDIERFGF